MGASAYSADRVKRPAHRAAGGLRVRGQAGFSPGSPASETKDAAVVTGAP